MEIKKIILMLGVYFRLWINEKVNLLLSFSTLILIIVFSRIQWNKNIFYYTFSFLIIQPILLFNMDTSLIKNHFFDIFNHNNFWRWFLKVTFIYSLLFIYIIVVFFFHSFQLWNYIGALIASYLLAIRLYQIKSLVSKLILLSIATNIISIINYLSPFSLLVVIGLLLIVFIKGLYNERYY